MEMEDDIVKQLDLTVIKNTETTEAPLVLVTFKQNAWKGFYQRVLIK